ncbi:hypothetical protein [Nocardioides sp.]|uniref:hypothetical protein n=1 Tax=Nocardioides sp. TaxID=35761 RepID=UPI002CE80B25|nr:hypothetical protein [Nocardioides sp.]HXH80329.1 hypothetical protein [Nocardioides sp.]
MTQISDQLLIPRRFCGPPDSANGGWTAGALATHLTHASPANRVDGWPPVEVSLRQPPPLDTALQVVEDEGTTTAVLDGTAVATARRVEVALTDVDPVPVDEARGAEAAYPGHRFHPFPTCFSCGTARDEGDGLRIFPGPVSGGVAATWRPDPSLSEDWHTYVDASARASVAATWAALDCVGGWAGDLTERLMVLGRMTTRITTLPVIGEEHVVVGVRRGGEGRKTFTAASLYGSEGQLVASAEHVWIAVDPAAFGGVSPG